MNPNGLQPMEAHLGLPEPPEQRPIGSRLLAKKPSWPLALPYLSCAGPHRMQDSSAFRGKRQTPPILERGRGSLGLNSNLSSAQQADACLANVDMRHHGATTR